MRTLLYILVLCPLFGSAVQADWHWYSGDLRLYSTHPSAEGLPTRIRQAIDADLDWRILYGPTQEGVFTGLPELIRENRFNDPRVLVPLLATQWVAEEAPDRGFICFGLDPRTPLPRGPLERLPALVNAQGGLAVLEKPEHLGWASEAFGASPLAFIGLSESGWHEASLPGGVWDSLLTTGRKVIMLDGGHLSSRTYVWAESPHPRHLIPAFRKGSGYVAEKDGIRVEIQVENQTLGHHISAPRDVFLRLRASAHDPISQVQIIADGRVIETHEPGVARWELRRLLSLGNPRYLRFVLESHQGAYRTLTNPIFLTSETHLDTGEYPTDLPLTLPLHHAADNALELLVGLQADAKRNILSEYLRHPGLSYATALVLEIREDAVSEDLLMDLARHADPDVRLGAIFSLVVRNGPLLSNFLLGKLDDEDPHVRGYAARMLTQFSRGLDHHELVRALRQADPGVSRYLIRALSPVTYDAELLDHLLRASSMPDRGVSAAATQKLIEMGNRSYGVITTLLDSARAGYATAFDILGAVGDRRVADEIKKQYRQAAPGPIKRSSFLALQNLGVEYPDRPQFRVPLADPGPVIDGHLSPNGWAQAPFLPSFVEDGEGGSPLQNMVVRIARDSTRLYLAFDVPGLDTLSGPERPLSIEVTGSPYPFREPPFRYTIALGDTEKAPHKMEIAQSLHKNRWILEWGFDFAALGVDPGKPIPYLRFNMSLISGSRRWSWTPTFGNPNIPERFGNLLLSSSP